MQRKVESGSLETKRKSAWWTRILVFGFDLIYATLDAVKAQEVASRKAEPSLVLANHAAWGPGQLEAESVSGHWHTLPATAEVVFWRADADLWEVITKRVNGRWLSEILKLRGLPPDPQSN